MKTIILAARQAFPLTADQERAGAALLPVGSKPLVAHTLEALAAAGIRRATLVADARDHAALRDALATARLELEYSASEGEDPDAIVARLQPDIGEELLVVRGDILRSACIAEFLQRAQGFPGALTLAATIGGVPAGVRLVRPGAQHPLGLACDPQNDWHEGPPRIELGGARLALLRSAGEYHRALLDALAGRFDGLALGGRRAAEGVTLCRGARVHADSVRETPVYLGPGARVAEGAELEADVLVGAGARVEAGAVLRATIVMPGAAVPSGARLENAIVSGAEALFVETGLVVRLESKALAPPAFALVAAHLLRWAAGLAAMLLWPLALLARRAESHGEMRDAGALGGLVGVPTLQPALRRAPAHSVQWGGRNAA